MAQAQRTPARSGGSTSDSAATIGRSARVRGRITGEGDLVVEGTVEGTIEVGGDVTVSGVLEGDVETRGAVHIQSGARVRGNVRSDDVALDEGAEFAGELSADFELPADLREGPAPSRGETVRGETARGETARRR